MQRAKDLRLHVFASGSRGNASLIENTSTGAGVLVDCGICKRDFFSHCEAIGFDPARLSALVITHEHTDHTKGLGVVMRGLAKVGYSPAIYVHSAIRCASKEIQSLQDSCDIQEFELGDALSFSGIQTHVFRTSHDAASSCGFRFESACGDVSGFITDSGVVTPEAHEGLQGARILALESNHDVLMLEEGPYPYPIKRRVASEVGHLSNVQAAEELESLLDATLEQVVAMHVSQNNNTYRLPVDALSAIVARNGHSAHVQTAFQAKPISVS